MKNKKNLIAFMLIILHLIYLPSCDSIKKISFKRFEKKYQYAEIDELLNNPKEFIEDFNSIKISPLKYKEDEESFFDGWTLDEKQSSSDETLSRRSYSKNSVLFNVNVEYGVSLDFATPFIEELDVYCYVDSPSIKFISEDSQENFKIGKALADGLFNIYDNAQNIQIIDMSDSILSGYSIPTYEDATESEWLQRINDNTIEGYLMVFGNEDENKETNENYNWGDFIEIRVLPTYVLINKTSLYLKKFPSAEELSSAMSNNLWN